MSRNIVCELLDIEYPIFQGGMAWIADAELAAAVSNAGGLGIIAAMNSDGARLREEIIKAQSLTDKTFGVNLMLMSPYIDEAVDAVIATSVKVVTTGAGNPSKYMERLLNAGIKVIPVVASVRIAQMMEKSGAAAVIAEGMESGGHVGETTTMSLLPQVVDALNIPVIAAGGIADGRGLAAAVMLGAKGIQMGTRFLTATECNVHDNYKQAVLKAGDRDTIVTGKSLGHPVRALKNSMTREFLRIENSGGTNSNELERMGAGALRRAAIEGDIKTGSCMCGQIAGLVNSENTCKEIIEGIYNDAIKIISGAGQWAK